MSSAPLVEAIFEIRWQLDGKGTKPPVDSNYKIFLGRMFDRVIQEYPHHVSLPTANLPDEISAYVAQHQFRKGKDEWPLIQIGQGILTLNDTEAYSWSDFQQRAQNLTKMMFDAYPDPKKLRIRSLLIRYLNGKKFNFEKHDPVEFLKKLQCNIAMDDTFFITSNTKKKMTNFNFYFEFPLNHPKGRVITRYGRGILKGQSSAIVWEMGVISDGNDAPKTPDGMVKWIDESHEIPHKWYNSIKDNLGVE